MAHVRLRAPLKELAGGRSDHESRERRSPSCCATLERDHPAMGGWVLDERGRIRAPRQRLRQRQLRQRGDAGRPRRPRPRAAVDLGRVRDDAASGRNEEGPVRARRRRRAATFEIGARGFEGQVGRVRDARPAERAVLRLGEQLLLRARRSGTRTTPPASGSRPRGSAARGRGEGARADLGDRRPARRTARSTRAATPPCSSRATTAAPRGSSTGRSGSSPTRPDWQPGFGGLCLHSIAPWPGDPQRLALGISAVGVWLTDDGGKTWRHGNKGLVPRVHARGGARGHDRPLRPQPPPRADAAGAAVHAVPRRRLPLGRRRRVAGPTSATGLPLRFRLPARRRSGRRRQRLRDPADRRPGPRHAGRAGACLRDPRRGRAAGTSAATGCRRRTRT